MAQPDPVALILAPGGRDARVAAAILSEVGIASRIHESLADLVADLDAAADFVAFAAGREAAGIIASSDGMVPARLDTIVEEVFTQPGQDPRNSQVFATSLRRSDPMPYHSAWPRVVELVERTFSRLFLGAGFDPAEELEDRLVKLDEQSETLFGGSD